MTESMTIGKLAQASGVGVETIRFYQRKGLIEQPSYFQGCGFRTYDSITIQKLDFIRRAKNLGFSLQEIKDLLKLRANSQQKCSSVKAKAAAKIVEISGKITDLIAIKAALEKLVLSCEAKIPSSSCPVIDELEKMR
jgi:MerR family mercuric resistance operon transcriptional regulator